MSDIFRYIIGIISIMLILAAHLFFESYFDCRNKESQRFIIFKLSESGMPCEEMINYVKDNL